MYEVNVSQWCFDSPKMVTKKDSSDWSLQFGRKNEERKKLDLPHPHPETVGTRITSSARTSRGRKFPKGKELYSTERICL